MTHTAMAQALEILGYPTYHGVTLIANPSDAVYWNRALDAKYFGKGNMFTLSNWDSFLGSYAALTDLPAVAFAEDLINSYPNAKVVLVERDIDKWYRSFNEGIIQNVWNPTIRFIAKLDRKLVGRLGSVADRWTEGWMEAHSMQEMQQKARPKYREHYAMIEKIISSDRLLKFELSQGWDPLCKFLGRDIPNVPFPRTNEAAVLQEKIGLIARRGIWNILTAVGPYMGAAVIAGAVLWFWI